MENMIELVSKLSVAVGALAIIVSVITQVVKELGPLSKIPTSFVVVILSLIVTPITFFAYASVENMATEWYMVAGSFVLAFFVAFVSMNGWEKLTEIINKFKKTGTDS